MDRVGLARRRVRVRRDARAGVFPRPPHHHPHHHRHQRHHRHHRRGPAVCRGDRKHVPIRCSCCAHIPARNTASIGLTSPLRACRPSAPAPTARARTKGRACAPSTTQARERHDRAAMARPLTKSSYSSPFPKPKPPTAHNIPHPPPPTHTPTHTLVRPADSARFDQVLSRRPIRSVVLTSHCAGQRESSPGASWLRGPAQKGGRCSVRICPSIPRPHQRCATFAWTRPRPIWAGHTEKMPNQSAAREAGPRAHFEAPKPGPSCHFAPQPDARMQPCVACSAGSSFSAVYRRSAGGERISSGFVEALRPAGVAR